jgi:acetolactate synthase-1/2/3 large subunit
MEGLRSNGIDFVLTHHETAGAIMAATIGDLTGIPGVVLTTLGPGATNVVTGVAQAYLDRSPLIAISAQLPNSRYNITPHQRVDLQALFQPITKGVARIDETNVSETLHWALKLATEGTPGPVFLQIPSDTVARTAKSSVAPYPIGSKPSIKRNRIDAALLQEAHEIIKTGKRPIAIFGLTAARSSSISAAALRFVEAYQLSFMHTPKAKGVIREDHPLFAGTLEMTGTSHLFTLLKDEIDLAIMVGVDTVEFDRIWDFQSRVLLIDSSPATSGYAPIHYELVGDILGILAALSETKGSPKWSYDEVRRIRSSLLNETPRGDGITRSRAIAIARKLLPETTILASDTGTNKMIAGQVWEAYAPMKYLVSNGLSTMGYALPAAIAAKLVFPNTPVLAIAGDGGLLMNMGEMATAARLGANISLMVLVDNALDQIRGHQLRRSFAALGTEFKTPTLTAVARAMEWEAVSAASEEDLWASERFLKNPSVPTLCEVMVVDANSG